MGWSIQIPGQNEEGNNRQISDYLADEERNKFWPIMWKHKTWRTEQWEKADRNPIPSKAIREQRSNSTRRKKKQASNTRS